MAGVSKKLAVFGIDLQRTRHSTAAACRSKNVYDSRQVMEGDHEESQQIAKCTQVNIYHMKWYITQVLACAPFGL